MSQYLKTKPARLPAILLSPFSGWFLGAPTATHVFDPKSALL
jgi:hypothetical protein